MTAFNQALPDGQLPTVERHKPEFSGRAGEYFGIWFVNLLLSIVTLGIYSAWAKVRTERYFYGHTRLAGASFEYLASPIAILKGRLIAYAFVIALSLAARFSIGLYAAMFVLLFALMPAIVVWSLRFRARNSAWRGVNFRFDAHAGEAYGPFMGWPILAMLTLYLLFPVMSMRQQAFVSGNHAFGKERFRFDGLVGPYYIPFLVVLGGGVVAMIAMVGMMGAAIFANAGQAAPTPPPTWMVPLFLAFYVGFFALGIYLRVRYANLFWKNTQLGEHRFESTLRARDMMWIYFSNLVAIVCTIGLAVPWAMVRLARYRSEHFALVAHGSLDGFVAEAGGRASATGAELVDALDVGLEFGI
jgi:uncharacterized membrane protein YjgN (DUF898 family)